ncbi:MAG: 2OG-Fe(II) oxygenase [Massilia sp.]
MQATPLGAGIFTIDNFLSADECRHYIALSERMGYQPSEVDLATGSRRLEEVRNNDRVLCDDVAMAAFLFERAEPFLPPELDGWALHGFNERLRFYRYGPGEYFKWHKDGTYVAAPGVESRLTFMIYLNVGFEGGDTQFRWDRVQPDEGRVLVFPHRQSHQGAELMAGTKYVLRTDVMYRQLHDDELPAN